MRVRTPGLILAASLLAAACGGGAEAPAGESKYLAEPLVSEIYTADPSAHVWDDGRIYIYPSHDIDAGIPSDDAGSHFAMRDYRVLSMDSVGAPVTVHEVALDIEQVTWAGRQMWAPDAAFKDGTYYLYFPAKDHDDIFRIGVATSTSPTGPFTPQPQPMANTYSIDPAVFRDDDGAYYLYWGGIWGGQLQRWESGAYDPNGSTSDLGNDNEPAIAPRVARLRDDMLELGEEPRRVALNSPEGAPLLAGDHDRRFFEGPWVFKRNGVYYFTYSTGDTHYLVYATGDSPYGPFTYRGRILEPVEGWTTHGSVFEHNDQWYLAYHDSQLSGGQTHLRNVKITPLTFNDDGTIQTIDPMRE